MEAHVNSIAVAERTVRTANDKQLAEEVDALSKRTTKLVDELKGYFDHVNALQQDKNSAVEAKLTAQSKELDKIDVDNTNFFYEMTAIKDKLDNETIDLAVQLQVEQLKAELESGEIGFRIEGIEEQLQLLSNDQASRVARAEGQEEAASRKTEAEVEEAIERKVAHVYEQLRNDNLAIWKESLQLAEKEFSEKGVEGTKSLLP